MRKIERFLRVGMLVFSIFGFLGLGLNQFASFVERGNQDNVAYVEALLGCINQGAPHVVFVGDEPYCHMIYAGSDRIAPLKQLQQANP